MKDTIKVLEERIKMLDDLYDSAKKTANYPEQWHSNTDDLKEAVKAIKSLDQAESELPPKLAPLHYKKGSDGYELKLLTLGSNQMHDIATPILAKKNMEIEELKKQTTNLANFIMKEVEGEPSQSQGAIETAIRIIKGLKEKLSEERITHICLKNLLKSCILGEVIAMNSREYDILVKLSNFIAKAITGGKE